MVAIHKARTLLVVGAFCLVGVCAYLVLLPNVGTVEPEPERQANERRMIREALARIDAESEGREPVVVVEAARRSTATVARTPPTARPDPPEGYSFATFHGEMQKGRMGNRPPVKGETARDGLGWIGTPAVIAELADQADRANRPWSFGWIRLASDARLVDVESALSDLGAEVVGSAGRLVRARLPAGEGELRAIATLPGIDGIGAMPPRTKLAPALADSSEMLPGPERVPVFVTLMEGDPDGRWRRELEALGATVGRFDPAIRVYPANIAYGSLAAIAATDFVLAVEPVGVVEATHDTAIPAMGGDALRDYVATDGLFAGITGAAVPIGVMDSGLNINHVDIESGRNSICGANIIAPSSLREEEDLWIDVWSHGTHVTGTIAGAGAAEPRFAGMAPGVPDIRFAKVLTSYGVGNDLASMRGMDYLAEATACGNEAPPRMVKPSIVNMSLSRAGRVFDGRRVEVRKLDSVVWSHRQLYVVAQANHDIHGFSNYGAAKNALSVGAVMDGGHIASFSSHGPSADGRLKPQLVATGIRVHSAQGNGSRGGYRVFDGTSMASPTAAGVAALLLDAAPEHREQPALTRARLMASAIRPDPWLTDESVFPSNNTGGPGALQAQYGMGRTSARTTVLDRDQPDGWSGGSAVAVLSNGEYGFVDIDVPANASRLDLVMTWDEPPADAIASTVLNDLDLWLDQGGDCPMAACGEHASTSDVDNVEWIIVRNPPPGTWRAKVTAPRIYTESPRAALAWTVIRGDSTPNLRIDVDKGVLAAGENEIVLTLTTDAYVAAGIRVHFDCRDATESTACDDVEIESVTAVREDGLVVDLAEESMAPDRDQLSQAGQGESFPVGEVAAGTARDVELVVSNTATSPVLVKFAASAWNAVAAAAIVRAGPSADEPSAPVPPENDAFAAAAAIEGEEGSVAVDLFSATPEPGEPAFAPSWGRPAGSVWYAWTAPADGTFRFEVGGALEHARSSVTTGSTSTRASGFRVWRRSPRGNGARSSSPKWESPIGSV